MAKQDTTGTNGGWMLPIFGLAVLLSLVAFAYAFIPSSVANAVSFVLGVWGVLVTVIGLGVAIWQLRRTASATMAAASAVQRLRSDVGILDVVAEVGSCKQQIGMAIDRLNEGNWRSACAHMAPVRSALNRIIALPDKFPQADSDEFKNHISFLIASETELDPLGDEEGEEGFDSSDMRMNLRIMNDSLSQFETKLRDKFGGQ